MAMVSSGHPLLGLGTNGDVLNPKILTWIAYFNEKNNPKKLKSSGCYLWRAVGRGPGRGKADGGGTKIRTDAGVELKFYAGNQVFLIQGIEVF